MFIAKTQTHESKRQGHDVLSMHCPYCQQDLAGPSNFAVYRHQCGEDVLFFVNGYIFVGVGQYNYTESRSTWKNQK